MNKVVVGLLCLLMVVLLFCTVFFSCFPVGRTMWNSWFFAVQKADDATAYSTRKQVEDTCRAMMTSYNEYVLKNSFVWNGNVPADIRTSLPYLD